MSEIDLSILEETINYKFNNQKYLKIALTHKSYLDEEPGYLSNQRYEFLGDTILDFDLTLYLFNKKLHIPPRICAIYLKILTKVITVEVV